MTWWDPHYLLFVALPLLVISGLATAWVKSAYAKYSRVPNRRGMTGAEAARRILESAGIHDVGVEMSQGWLSDHYDPRHKVLRLSPDNFRGRSIAAVGIAAHEGGHAVQHATRYAPLVVRNLAVPMANIGSNLGYFVILIGWFMSLQSGANPLNIVTAAGLALLAGVVVFQLVNLPVEFNASRRALQFLPQMGILTEEENRGVRAMLTAAAMTYVAATIAAVAQLLFWLWRLGLLGGRRD